MHLAFHGGKCCGIKTIYELGDDPSDITGALTALPSGKQEQDILYNTTDTKTRFFHLEAPFESREKRLDRYIDFIKERRPQHIIEITLAEGLVYTQKKGFPVLESRGFKRINSCKNSNSGNTVHVYHLNVGE